MTRKSSAERSLRNAGIDVEEQDLPEEGRNAAPKERRGKTTSGFYREGGRDRGTLKVKSTRRSNRPSLRPSCYVAGRR